MDLLLLLMPLCILSMVLDKVSGSVGIDYAKGIKIISDAVQASGQVAYDAGMSYEQLAAITAKVSERTR